MIFLILLAASFLYSALQHTTAALRMESSVPRLKIRFEFSTCFTFTSFFFRAAWNVCVFECRAHFSFMFRKKFVKTPLFGIAAHESSLENGFKCPEVAPKDAFGISDPHPKYADPSDCAKFYICLNGVTPREQGCELGLVYNELSQSCDSPKNVPEW